MAGGRRFCLGGLMLSTPIEFLVAYVGIAGLALFLLDRAHRNAFSKLSAVYDKELEHQAILIEVLKMALGIRPEQEKNEQ